MPKRLSDQRFFQDYVNVLNRLLNTTLTVDRLTLSGIQASDTRLIEHKQGNISRLPLALQPKGSYLFFLQRIRRESSPKGDNIIVEDCSYRFSTSARLEDEENWIVRYEYSLAPPPNQPPAHLHMNAVHKHIGYPMDQLHLPSGRISVEQFLAHLVLEHGVQTLADVSLEQALGIFRDGHEEFSRRRTDVALFP